MRSALSVVFVCLVLPFPGQAEDPPATHEQIDHEANHEEWEKRFAEGELKSLIKKTPDPFRRWSDGSASFVGDVLWERSQDGYAPSPGDEKIHIVLGGFNVLDVTDGGVRIHTPGSQHGYVKGMTGYSARSYSRNLMLKRTGSYHYKTILGSTRNIPGYEYGQPITQEEYLKSLKPVVVQKPSGTNATNRTSQPQ